MARKRSATTFNLSFLDVMSCGFGAVVLVFLIMDHAIKVQSSELNSDMMSEVNLLEEEVLERLRVAAQTRVRVSTWRHPVPSAAGPGAPQKAAPHKPQRDRTWYVLYARAAYSTAFLSVCMPVLPCPCHAAGHAPLWARAWPGAPTGAPLTTRSELGGCNHPILLQVSVVTTPFYYKLWTSEPALQLQPGSRQDSDERTLGLPAEQAGACSAAAHRCAASALALLPPLPALPGSGHAARALLARPAEPAGTGAADAGGRGLEHREVFSPRRAQRGAARVCRPARGISPCVGLCVCALPTLRAEAVGRGFRAGVHTWCHVS